MRQSGSGVEPQVSPDIVGGGKGGSSVKQDLDDLVVICVSSQDQRGDVRCEGGRVGGYRLPALGEIQIFTVQFGVGL